MFTNEFENTIYNEVLKPFTNERIWFRNDDPFWHYINQKNKLTNNSTKSWLFINVPKSYGENTNTEMVLIKNKSCRIDCKKQDAKGSLTIGNIMYEIYTNTVLNRLHEDYLIFVVDGKGIDWNVLRTYRNTLPTYIKIFSFEEFEEFIKKQLG